MSKYGNAVLVSLASFDGCLYQVCVSLPVCLYVVMGVSLSPLIDALKVANTTDTVVHSQTLLQSTQFSLTAAWGPGFAFSAGEPTLAQVLEQQPLIAMATIPLLLLYSDCAVQAARESVTALNSLPMETDHVQTGVETRHCSCMLLVSL